MKNYTIFLFLLIIVLMNNGCNFFKKDQPKEIPTDTIADVIEEGPIEADTASYQVSSAQQIQSANVDDGYSGVKVYSNTDSFEGKYHIIIGSFQSLEFAKIHAEKYHELGYKTIVIRKPDGFNMVSGGWFNDYDEAKQKLPHYKKNVAVVSWIYNNV